jgi:hypothetical protein
LQTEPERNAEFKETARRSGPFLLITYRYRWSGRAAPWDACHPLREPDSAGRVFDHRPAAGRASGPVFDFAARVGLGSSWCFLSWERQYNGPPFGFVPDKENAARNARNYVSLTYSGLPLLVSVATAARRAAIAAA